MNINHHFEKVKYFIFICFLIIFIFGGIGLYPAMAIFFAITCTISLFGYLLIRNGSIKIPDNFLVFTILLIAMFLHVTLINGKLMFLWLFISGGLIWIVFYNLKSEILKYFFPVLVFTGYVMAGIFVYFKLMGIFPGTDNLFYAPTALIHHNHLGDLWALILIFNFYEMTKKIRGWNWLIMGSGILFILISSSRSSYVTLIVGITYLLFATKPKEIIRNTAIGILILAGIFFIYTSFFKSVLFSRPYFIQSIAGVYYQPLGVGMGNFSDIKLSIQNIFGEDSSTVVHNILLEFISGMGLFSIIFIYWLAKVLEHIFDYKKLNLNTEFIAIFIAILTNFLFDATYVIPTYVWIWFISLALI